MAKLEELINKTIHNLGGSYLAIEQKIDIEAAILYAYELGKEESKEEIQLLKDALNKEYDV